MEQTKYGFSAVHIYNWGLVSLSACAPKDMPIEDIVQAVNTLHPTGIDNYWALAEDETFSGGEPNPCTCEHDAERLHYLFHC